jgi:hypothetical protein
MNVRACVAAFFLSMMAFGAVAQEPGGVSPKNTWTVFTEYSDTSSHILLGLARDRELVTLGGSYARRLWRWRAGDFSYLAEIRPLVYESDPVEIHNFTEMFTPPPATISGQSSNTVISPCVASTSTLVETLRPGMPMDPVVTLTVTDHVTCGRRWSYAQAFAPLGIKQSFRTGKAIQPFVAGTAGYMYSSVPLPTENSGSFNFAFDFGVGVEMLRGPRRSMSLEYRFHHFSNKNTALENPGVDNGVFKLSYNFRR